jgi:squalene-associated FAD-dependent desaturase
VDRNAHALAVPVSPGAQRIAVVGAGWAGLAAAVQAVRQGQAVTLFDSAPQPGGRARSVEMNGLTLDNGQHILIGAYRDTLALMRSIGADPERLLCRMPLELVDAKGHGLRLPPGAPWLSFARGVIAHRGWSLGDRLALLGAAGRWLMQGFRCDPALTVRALTAGLPARVRDELVDPLCVAALNTPAPQASAAVFLRVLKDALFSGRGGADLLLPRAPLQALLPGPAAQWLQSQGAVLQWRRRVQSLAAQEPTGWLVDGEAFDAVVLACGANEAARLVAGIAPEWAQVAGAFEHEPIVTAWLKAAGAALPAPIVALATDAEHPAQFAFDLGQLGHEPGMLAFVVSGARECVARGLEASGEAMRRQALRAFDGAPWVGALEVVKVMAEKRATFLCTPGLQRPGAPVAPGLVAAGDYIDGPYPATLEGAVRSGLAAAKHLGG